MFNGWGVYFWMVLFIIVFVSFNCWYGWCVMSVLVSNKVKYRGWEYVGIIYDYWSGIVRLFVRDRFVVFKWIGCFIFVINYFVRMGVR